MRKEDIDSQRFGELFVPGELLSVLVGGGIQFPS